MWWVFPVSGPRLKYSASALTPMTGDAQVSLAKQCRCTDAGVPVGQR